MKNIVKKMLKVKLKNSKESNEPKESKELNTTSMTSTIEEESNEQISVLSFLVSIREFLKDKGYNLYDYELVTIGEASQPISDYYSNVVWYYSVHLREYKNKAHEVVIRIPMYKDDSHISTNIFSTDVINSN